MKKALLTIGLAMATILPAFNVAQAAVVEKELSWFKKGWYSAGQTLEYKLDKSTYVEKLLISAEGASSFAIADVYADGEFVSRMGVPGRDPDYPVVIRKKVSSVIVKFQGSIKITDMRAYIDEGNFHEGRMDEIRNGDDRTPEGLAETTLSVVGILQDEVSMANFQKYLLPLRKAALKLAASGGGRSFLSGNTRTKAIILINEIKKVDAYLEHLAENRNKVEAVQTLMFVKERLESIYEIHD